MYNTRVYNAFLEEKRRLKPRTDSDKNRPKAKPKAFSQLEQICKRQSDLCGPGWLRPPQKLSSQTTLTDATQDFREHDIPNCSSTLILDLVGKRPGHILEDVDILDAFLALFAGKSPYYLLSPPWLSASLPLARRQWEPAVGVLASDTVSRRSVKEIGIPKNIINFNNAFVSSKRQLRIRPYRRI